MIRWQTSMVTKLKRRSKITRVKLLKEIIPDCWNAKFAKSRLTDSLFSQVHKQAMSVKGFF